MEEAVKNNPVEIYFESNPNPNTLKFVANFMLVPEGLDFDFPNPESADSSELAQELFTLSFVKGVFFMSNFITVSKDESTDWDEVKDGVKAQIKSYLETGKSCIDMSKVPKAVQEEVKGSDIDENIKGILDEYIRPAVEQDGGAINFHSFEDGLVKVVEGITIPRC